MQLLQDPSLHTWLDAVRRLADSSLAGKMAEARWFRSKDRKIRGIELADGSAVKSENGLYFLLLFSVHFESGSPELYFWPWTGWKAAECPATPLFVISSEPEGDLSFTDSLAEEAFRKWFSRTFREEDRIPLLSGEIQFHRHVSLPDFGALDLHTFRPLGAEQSNSSFVIRHENILKIYRKLDAEINPEVEMLAFLNEHGFKAIPELRGDAVYRQNTGEQSSLAMLQSFVSTTGDGWRFAVQNLASFYQTFVPELTDGDVRTKKAEIDRFLEPVRSRMAALGELTSGMHAALASDSTNDNFSSEFLTKDDIMRWRQDYEALLALAMKSLRQKEGQAGTKPAVKEVIRKLLPMEPVLQKRSESLQLPAVRVPKIRFHGDYHLGQAALAAEGWILFDFEGEPLRDIHERKRKACPLRDVAGMVRSFHYAAHVSAHDFLAAHPEAAETVNWLKRLWEKMARKAFLSAYFEAAGRAKVAFLSADNAVNETLLNFFELEKAVYELNYELNNRPEWIFVPADGLSRLLDAQADSQEEK